jgi:hypothetical protein
MLFADISGPSCISGFITSYGTIPDRGILPSDWSGILKDHSSLLLAAFDPHAKEEGKK